MKSSFKPGLSGTCHTMQQGRTRIGLIAATALLAALVCAGLLHYRSVQANRMAGSNSADGSVLLSDSTKAVLNGLKSPIEIRFYSLLDPASTPDSLRAYAERVNSLLTEYERAGKGNIHVVRYDTLSDTNANAAAADGIRSFNRDKGDACYLGIAAICDGQKESIVELSPTWEQALESDLSRVVAHVNETGSAATAAPAKISNNDLAAAEKAIQSNPNLASASLEQGTQILRDEALAQFKTAVTEMQDRSKTAEQALNSGASQADVAKQLQQIRAEETEKIQTISAQLHNQLAALEQSKKAGK